MHKKITNKGFTLLEVLLVVAAIAILAGIAIFAINPGKQLAEMRNGKREADLSLIVSALYQYAIDNGGNLPDDLRTQADSDCENYAEADICMTGSPSHFCGVDLSALTDNQKYLVSVPIDPAGAIQGVDGTGYFIQKNENGRIIACAPNAELGKQIRIVK